MAEWNHSSVILNLVSGWEWLAPAALFPGNHSPAPLTRRVSGLQSRSLLPLPGIEPRFLGSTHSLVSIPTELSRLSVLK